MQREWVSVFVGLGANLGDARLAVENAVKSMDQLPDTQVLACSALYRSAPVDATGPDYLNAVVHLKTRVNAIDLLRSFQALENLAGRERPYHHAPRTLDIDVLLYGDAKIDSPELTVPHPRMHERAFVMYPLSELVPALADAAHLKLLSGQVIHQLDVYPFGKPAKTFHSS
jgi:2-amino-4-hydroxy-6-hydroxymethyldihydropteridine diphosphokinase